jgi:hypothetical protein
MNKDFILWFWLIGYGIVGLINIYFGVIKHEKQTHYHSGDIIVGVLQIILFMYVLLT